MKNSSERKLLLLIALTGISTMAIIASNLLATKLFDFCGTAVDCGIILYPVSYIVGDLTVEYFGKNIANRVVVLAAGLCLGTAALLQLAVFLPPYPGWEGQAAFASIFGLALRVSCASIAAFVVSGFANNIMFERLRRRGFATRALGSSALAHLIDSAVFETLAFIGVLPIDEFLCQALFAYLAGFGLEAALFLFCTRPISWRVNRWLAAAD